MNVEFLQGGGVWVTFRDLCCSCEKSVWTWKIMKSMKHEASLKFQGREGKGNKFRVTRFDSYCICLYLYTLLKIIRRKQLKRQTMWNCLLLASLGNLTSWQKRGKVCEFGATWPWNLLNTLLRYTGSHGILTTLPRISFITILWQFYFNFRHALSQSQLALAESESLMEKHKQNQFED